MLSLRPEVVEREELLSVAFALWYPDPRDPTHHDPVLSAYALARAGLARRGGFKGKGMHRRYAHLPRPGAHLTNVARGLPELTRFAGYWARNRWLGPRRVPNLTVRPAGGTYRLRIDAEQLPDPANRAFLLRDRDSHGMPRLRVEHRISGRDRELLLRSVDRAFQALQASGAASVRLPNRAEMDVAIMNDGTHQMGLTAMSTRPETGVVDAQCRVHGVPNTYVAGPSVFPTSGMAGPVLTTVALALRLAGHLSSRLGSEAAELGL
jgi:hypothetical protein